MENDIPLSLNSYEDLFSSFDFRDYSEKALSQDFINECKRAVHEKETVQELKLFIHDSKRNIRSETQIRKRMKDHFQKHFHEKNKQLKTIKREGILWFFVGAILMFLTTFMYGRPEFFYKFLFIIMEPASWFMFWEGLYKVFISSKEIQPDFDFYRKMDHAQVNFYSK